MKSILMGKRLKTSAKVSTINIAALIFIYLTLTIFHHYDLHNTEIGGTIYSILYIPTIIILYIAVISFLLSLYFLIANAISKSKSKSKSN